ncbi:MAG: cyclic pyranopterin monophosphate synthase MoaC [Candidatus Bathyarchaeia archaeon]
MSMIDITTKPEIYREATARGQIKLRPETVRLIREGSVEKGDPIYTAKIAGILAAKNTSALIPLCHPIPITDVDINVKIVDESTLEVEATVKSRAQTGVEMEALVATSTALLTIWDMVKKYEKDPEGQYLYTSIQNIRVIKKVKGE